MLPEAPAPTMMKSHTRRNPSSSTALSSLGMESYKDSTQKTRGNRRKHKMSIVAPFMLDEARRKITQRRTSIPRLICLTISSRSRLSSYHLARGKGTCESKESQYTHLAYIKLSQRDRDKRHEKQEENSKNKEGYTEFSLIDLYCSSVVSRDTSYGWWFYVIIE